MGSARIGYVFGLAEGGEDGRYDRDGFGNRQRYPGAAYRFLYRRSDEQRGCEGQERYGRSDGERRGV